MLVIGTMDTHRLFFIQIFLWTELSVCVCVFDVLFLCVCVCVNVESGTWIVPKKRTSKMFFITLLRGWQFSFLTTLFSVVMSKTASKLIKNNELVNI